MRENFIFQPFKNFRFGIQNRLTTHPMRCFCCFFSYFWYCKHLQTHTDTHNCLCHFTIMMACVFESFFFLFVLMMIIQKEKKIQVPHIPLFFFVLFLFSYKYFFLLLLLRMSIDDDAHSMSFLDRNFFPLFLGCCIYNIEVSI